MIMIRILLINILFFIFSVSVFSQTKTELENQRRKALEEIQYVDNILKTTVQERTEGVNSLRVLNSKVRSRESVINNLNEEIQLVQSKIESNTTAIEMMEYDLQQLRLEYKNAVVNSYNTIKTNSNIVFILSASDFNQAYKRFKYLQQITKYRREQAELIVELKTEIEKARTILETDLAELSSLKNNELNQAQLLKQEQVNQQRIINNLNKKEKELQKELKSKQELANKIDKEIEKLLIAEKNKNKGGNLTPEQELISNNFAENKGRLPWPVERGIITNKFGKHQHPVFKHLTEDNIGIEITSTGTTIARSIFKGEVSAITAISGSNMTVIIRHGNYLSVYNNIVNVKVKKGDMVDTKQAIGEVYSDPNTNNNCILKFMIFNTEYLNPENWIAKN